MRPWLSQRIWIGQAISGNSSSLANRFTSKRGSTLNAFSSSAGLIHLLAPRLAAVVGNGGTLESSIFAGTALPCAKSMYLTGFDMIYVTGAECNPFFIIFTLPNN